MEKTDFENKRKQEKIPDYIDTYTEPPKDNDWMYKSILKGAFSGRKSIDKDVFGNHEASEDTQQ